MPINLAPSTDIDFFFFSIKLSRSFFLNAANENRFFTLIKYFRMCHIDLSMA